jgi:hypothetical protein
LTKCQAQLFAVAGRFLLKEPLMPSWREVRA